MYFKLSTKSRLRNEKCGVMAKYENSEVRLKRFLYLASEDARYITGNPERYGYYQPEKVPSIVELLLQSENPELFVNIVQIASSELLLPRRETLFFSLAYAASLLIPADLKHKIYTTVINLVRSPEDLFVFIKHFSLLKKTKSFPSGINKVISVYYTKKDPQELAHEITQSKGYHGWKHKDLIKLSHCKADNVLFSIIATYILKGLKTAREIGQECEGAADIVNYFSKIDELKRSEDEKRVVELVKELHCNNLHRVPSFFHKNLNVWQALIPEISIGELLTHLSKFHKHGFLKNSSFQNTLIENLTNADKIRNEKLHPISVFICLKIFEKGGKPLDPKLEKFLVEQKKKEKEELAKMREIPTCPAVFTAIHKVLTTAFHNPQSTGKRFMITIEISNRMSKPCLTNKSVTCMEASVILALSILKVEKETTIAVFRDTKVFIINFEKGVTFGQAMNRLKQLENARVVPAAPFHWASNKKKPIDVFIHCLSYHHWWSAATKKEPPHELLKKYKKKLNLPNTKLITMSLNSPLPIHASSKDVLDICGFNEEIPNVIDVFSRHMFD